MSVPKRTSKALALLIPTGVIGISSALATTQIHTTEDAYSNGSVAGRLSEIRQAVSAAFRDEAEVKPGTADGVKLTLAEWLNFGGGMGWRNGGWRNGGWHNWGNGGWHNWGNGGWHNGGWGNGWHNFWHNW